MFVSLDSYMQEEVEQNYLNCVESSSSINTKYKCIYNKNVYNITYHIIMYCNISTLYF